MCCLLFSPEKSCLFKAATCHLTKHNHIIKDKQFDLCTRQSWDKNESSLSVLYSWKPQKHTVCLQDVHTVSEGRRSCLWALPGLCWSLTACSASLCCGQRSVRRAPSRVSWSTLVREPWAERRMDSRVSDRRLRLLICVKWRPQKIVFPDWQPWMCKDKWKWLQTI